MAVISDSTAQLFIIAERAVLGSADNAMGALIGLIDAYYAFNMVYPKPLYAVLLFVQHFILNLKDKQAVPNVIAGVLSCLD